eukprot:CCRYP_016022-RA/>CCRYP_016022-RA protein AED:0.17 eAED:0.27 QI:0/0/0/1/0/0/2/0/179
MPANNVQQLGDTGGPQAWFQSLPFVTRYWFGSALLSHAPPTRFHQSHETHLPLGYHMGRFPDLAFCHPIFPTVRDRALQHWCRRRTADYIFALMFGMSTIFVTYPLLGKLLPILPLFARTLTFFVIYVWSKRHPTAPASIWGVEMKAIHLLFAYLVLTVLMGNPYADRMVSPWDIYSTF